MRILLSNDDGYTAQGLLCLRAAMADGNELTVVAPDRNRSGASNSLTLLRPLRAQQHPDGIYSVDGTPTDCVHLALNALMEAPPDLVLSGINHGANLGDDTLYSGTVAAAMEGRWLGRPAIAFSCVAHAPKHLDVAARVAQHIVSTVLRAPLPADTILNVNIPDLPFDQLRGYEVTRLGHRHRAESVVAAQDPRGRPIYWISASGPGADAGPGTDFHAIEQQRVSITPLTVDLTRHAALADIGRWAAAL
jgi:5'-nucleotidase